MANQHVQKQVCQTTMRPLLETSQALAMMSLPVIKLDMMEDQLEILSNHAAETKPDGILEYLGNSLFSVMVPLWRLGALEIL